MVATITYMILYRKIITLKYNKNVTRFKKRRIRIRKNI